MADLGIVSDDVLLSTTNVTPPIISKGFAEEAINAGQLVAVTPTGHIGLHDSSMPEYENARGIALNNAGTGQPIEYIEKGLVNLGGVSTAGENIVASFATNGGLAPHADLLTTNAVVGVGYMLSNSVLKVDIDNLGIAKG